MALSDILDRIKHDAEASVKGIRDEAEEKATAILDQARAEAREIAKTGHSDAERAAAKARGRIVAGAAHEAKFAIQSFRASLIDRVFGDAQGLLVGLPDGEYRAFIVSRARGLSGASSTLTVAAEREEATRAALKDAGVKAKEILAARENELLGGFIFETETAVYDHSIRAIMAEARDRHTGDVARQLFAQNT